MDPKVLKERHRRGERDFQCAQLSGSDLSWMNLQGADFKNADFYGANLSGAILTLSNLSSETNLAFADLSRADLSAANLCSANLEGANLEETILQEALFNEKTCFPKGFDPILAGMILFGTENAHHATPRHQIIQQTSTPSGTDDLKKYCASEKRSRFQGNSYSPRIGKKRLLPSANTRQRSSLLWISTICLLSAAVGGGVMGYTVFQIRTQQASDIQKATSLAQQSQDAQHIDSSEALKNSSDNLKQAVALLENIKPALGSHYHEAQAQLRELIPRLNAVENKLSQSQEDTGKFESARQHAEDAIQSVLKPPHSLEKWRLADFNLRQAIDLLETIPEGTLIAKQARKKLAQYEVHQVRISESLQLEEIGEQKLNSSQDLASEAITLTEDKTFYEVGDLESARDKWKNAIEVLKSTPKNTVAAKKANLRLPAYLQNHQNVSNGIQSIQNCTASDSVYTFSCRDIALQIVQISD
jgi:hypothetical protein